MAFSRGGKMDGRRPSSSPSSFCTTTTVVVFVALCLVGAWMMTSSTIFPLDMVSNKKSEVRKQPPPLNFGTSEEAASVHAGEGHEKFEDTDSTIPEQPTNKDSRFTDNTEEKSVETVEEQDLEQPKEKEEIKDAFDDANGKSEGRSDDVRNVEDEEKKDEEKSDEKKEDEEKKDDERSENDVEKKEDQEEKPEGDTTQEDQPQIEEKVEETGDKEDSPKSSVVFPDGAQSELLKESNAQNGSFPTQAAESKKEKEVRASSGSSGETASYSWKLCNSRAATDYIPCLDNEKAIKKLPSTKHYEHRERHCPEEPPTCLVPLPEGYKHPIEWPQSRDKVILFVLYFAAPEYFQFPNCLLYKAHYFCRYGTEMFLTPSLHSIRGIKTGLKSLVTISCFLEVELSSRMVHFTTLIPFSRFVIDHHYYTSYQVSSLILINFGLSRVTNCSFFLLYAIVHAYSESKASAIFFRIFGCVQGLNFYVKTEQFYIHTCTFKTPPLT
jgi:hypothetical protein